jgi:hypothetical protein
VAPFSAFAGSGVAILGAVVVTTPCRQHSNLSHLSINGP